MIICETTRTLCVEYSAPAHNCRRELRVAAPVARGGQTLLVLEWNCDPLPDFSEETFDDFSNRVLRLHHRQLENPFRFAMTLRTSHHGSTPVTRETNLPTSGVGAFSLPSALCDLSPAIQRAAAGLKGATPEDICNFVYGQLEYSPRTTNLQTAASQSLQSRRGVCQDFAQVMIALCRAQKTPARYVSGYLPGEGAMHAWCEVLVDEIWQGFDPTHNRRVREDYVFVACGRDFRDCAPVRGTFQGKARARLQSFCKTIALSSQAVSGS